MFVCKQNRNKQSDATNPFFNGADKDFWMPLALETALGQFETQGNSCVRWWQRHTF